MGITWSLGNAYEKYGGLREKVAAEPWAFRLTNRDGHIQGNLWRAMACSIGSEQTLERRLCFQRVIWTA